MKIAVLACVLVSLVAASGPVSWLDAKTIANWNVAGAPLPARSGPPDAELAPGGRCAPSLRPPSSPEDRALVARGWSPVGVYQRYGKTSVVVASASADGMCRPMGFEAFVFVGGAFAGTLSPKPMDARTDSSISGVNITLYNENDMAVDFSRYNAQDALCCPHATTSVTYRVQTAGRPRVIPVSAQTHANPG